MVLEILNVRWHFGLRVNNKEGKISPHILKGENTIMIKDLRDENGLLPCPFCYDIFAPAEFNIGTAELREDNGVYYVDCKRCGATTKPNFLNEGD